MQLSDTIESLNKKLTGAILRFLFSPKKSEFNPSTIRRILVVRQHDQLGDMICVVPLLKTLKQAFPGSHLTLVASPVNYAIMQANPWADRVINYDKKAIRSSPAKMVGFLEELRFGGGYDLAVVPATVSLSLTSDLIAALAGSKYRIGPGQLTGSPNPTADLFNKKVTLNWSDEPHRHQTLRNIDVLKPLKLTSGNPDESFLQCTLGLTDEEIYSGVDVAKFARENKPLVVGLHPGAGKSGNRWPVERFVELAQWLIKTHNAAILVTSGPMDAEVVNQFRSLARFQYEVIEQTPIREVAAILNALDLVISNDTGIMHIAGGLRPPVISLFGPTDPQQWAPKGPKNHFIAALDGNIASITLQSVQVLVNSVLLP